MSETLFRYAGSFLDALVRSGLRDLVLCPGSRSTPLALLAHRHRGVRTWMHLDERSAAFFALGLAKASGKPAAVLVTSGTAAANLFPAVVEARYGQVPLLLLTADRPPEAHDVGALQTIDQQHLFGRHAKWFQSLLLPEEGEEALRHAAVTAARAVAAALADPPGPVHLNLPFREPLIPGPEAWSPEGLARGVPELSAAPRRLPAAEVERLAERLRRARRGLMVAGPFDRPGFAEAAAELAAVLGWPLVADAFSGTRAAGLPAPTRVTAYDLWIRDPAIAAGLEPDVLLRFGALPVSKPLWQWLGRWRTVPHIAVAPGGIWPDPTLAAGEILDADPVLLCRDLREALHGLAGEGDPSWLERWLDLDSTARAAAQDRLAAESAVHEPGAASEAVAALPPAGALLAGNSMPIRDVDTFAWETPPGSRLFANRGASGIDGVVSTACGIAAAHGGPTVCLIGDLSFFHDSNGLLAVRRFGLAPVFVVIDNDGGGIFSFLPQAEHGEAFEEVFGTPHGLDLRLLARLHGLEIIPAERPGDVRRAVSGAIARGVPAMVHVRTDRRANVALHRDVAAAVARAVGATVVGERRQ
ncbi:2-succinyl-5-enolpyruvyl-6-hydroxy-3-cyclohexene-1-carboxylate synthase [bacterium HR29]|nr:2-succinyl-5-enolpyruvyl-6-hydroxy-3-cyclohexene-1-carboxylate synthase [bacterium HR29]